MNDHVHRTALERAPLAAPRIQGQLLRQSEHRAVAIYLRDGSAWVADFVGDRGVLIDVETWFRFNCGTRANPRALKRMSLEAATPLSPEMIARIESLHADMGHAGTFARIGAALSRLLPHGRLVMLVAARFRRRSTRPGRRAMHKPPIQLNDRGTP